MAAFFAKSRLKVHLEVHLEVQKACFFSVETRGLSVKKRVFCNKNARKGGVYCHAQQTQAFAGRGFQRFLCFFDTTLTELLRLQVQYFGFRKQVIQIRRNPCYRICKLHNLCGPTF